MPKTISKTISIYEYPPIQCKYNNKDTKKRCKRKSRKGPLCPQHLDEVHGLRIGKSALPGLGVFATKPFKRNEKIIEYEGVRRATVPHNTAYLAELRRPKDPRKPYIDATNPAKSNAARFINDCFDCDRRYKYSNNCAFWERDNRLWVRATKNIAEGDEIFVNYGEFYWNYIFTHRLNYEDFKKSRGKKGKALNIKHKSFKGSKNK